MRFYPQWNNATFNMGISKSNMQAALSSLSSSKGSMNPLDMIGGAPKGTLLNMPVTAPPKDRTRKVDQSKVTFKGTKEVPEDLVAANLGPRKGMQPAGEFFTSPTVRDQVFESDRNLTDAQKKAVRMGLPGELVQAEHISEKRFGGTDTSTNLQAMATEPHNLKTSVGAVADYIWNNRARIEKDMGRKIGLAEIRNLAANWDDKDLSGVNVKNGGYPHISEKGTAEADYAVALKKFREWTDRPYLSGKGLFPNSWDELKATVKGVASTIPIVNWAIPKDERNAIQKGMGEEAARLSEGDPMMRASLSTISGMTGGLLPAPITEGMTVPEKAAVLVGQSVGILAPMLAVSGALGAIANRLGPTSSIARLITRGLASDKMVKRGGVIANVLSGLPRTAVTLGAVGQISKQEADTYEARAKRLAYDLGMAAVMAPMAPGPRGVVTLWPANFAYDYVVWGHTPGESAMSATINSVFHATGPLFHDANKNMEIGSKVKSVGEARSKAIDALNTAGVTKSSGVLFKGMDAAQISQSVGVPKDVAQRLVDIANSPSQTLEQKIKSVSQVIIQQKAEYINDLPANEREAAAAEFSRKMVELIDSGEFRGSDAQIARDRASEELLAKEREAAAKRTAEREAIAEREGVPFVTEDEAVKIETEKAAKETQTKLFETVSADETPLDPVTENRIAEAVDLGLITKGEDGAASLPEGSKVQVSPVLTEADLVPGSEAADVSSVTSEVPQYEATLVSETGGRVPLGILPKEASRSVAGKLDAKGLSRNSVMSGSVKFTADSRTGALRPSVGVSDSDAANAVRIVREVPTEAPSARTTVPQTAPPAPEPAPAESPVAGMTRRISAAKAGRKIAKPEAPPPTVEETDAARMVKTEAKLAKALPNGGEGDQPAVTVEDPKRALQIKEGKVKAGEGDGVNVAYGDETTSAFGPGGEVYTYESRKELVKAARRKFDSRKRDNDSQMVFEARRHPVTQLEMAAFSDAQLESYGRVLLDANARRGKNMAESGRAGEAGIEAKIDEVSMRNLDREIKDFISELEWRMPEWKTQEVDYIQTGVKDGKNKLPDLQKVDRMAAFLADGVIKNEERILNPKASLSLRAKKEEYMATGRYTEEEASRRAVAFESLEVVERARKKGELPTSVLKDRVAPKPKAREQAPKPAEPTKEPMRATERVEVTQLEKPGMTRSEDVSHAFERETVAELEGWTREKTATEDQVYGEREVSWKDLKENMTDYLNTRMESLRASIDDFMSIHQTQSASRGKESLQDNFRRYMVDEAEGKISEAGLDRNSEEAQTMLDQAENSRLYDEAEMAQMQDRLQARIDDITEGIRKQEDIYAKTEDTSPDESVRPIETSAPEEEDAYSLFEKIKESRGLTGDNRGLFYKIKDVITGEKSYEEAFGDSDIARHVPDLNPLAADAAKVFPVSEERGFIVGEIAPKNMPRTPWQMFVDAYIDGRLDPTTAEIRSDRWIRDMDPSDRPKARPKNMSKEDIEDMALERRERTSADLIDEIKMNRDIAKRIVAKSEETAGPEPGKAGTLATMTTEDGRTVNVRHQGFAELVDSKNRMADPKQRAFWDRILAVARDTFRSQTGTDVNRALKGTAEAVNSGKERVISFRTDLEKEVYKLQGVIGDSSFKADRSDPQMADALTEINRLVMDRKVEIAKRLGVRPDDVVVYSSTRPRNIDVSLEKNVVNAMDIANAYVTEKAPLGEFLRRVSALEEDDGLASYFRTGRKEYLSDRLRLMAARFESEIRSRSERTLEAQNFEKPVGKPSKANTGPSDSAVYAEWIGKGTPETAAERASKMTAAEREVMDEIISAEADRLATESVELTGGYDRAKEYAEEYAEESEFGEVEQETWREQVDTAEDLPTTVARPSDETPLSIGLEFPDNPHVRATFGDEIPMKYMNGAASEVGRAIGSDLARQKINETRGEAMEKSTDAVDRQNAGISGVDEADSADYAAKFMADNARFSVTTDPKLPFRDLYTAEQRGEMTRQKQESWDLFRNEVRYADKGLYREIAERKGQEMIDRAVRLREDAKTLDDHGEVARSRRASEQAREEEAVGRRLKDAARASEDTWYRDRGKPGADLNLMQADAVNEMAERLDTMKALLKSSTNEKEMTSLNKIIKEVEATLEEQYRARSTGYTGQRSAVLANRDISWLRGYESRLNEMVKDLTETVAKTRDMGDLKENAGYDAARADLASAKVRLKDLRDILANSVEDPRVKSISDGFAKKQAESDRTDRIKAKLMGEKPIEDESMDSRLFDKISESVKSKETLQARADSKILEALRGRFEKKPGLEGVPAAERASKAKPILLKKPVKKAAGSDDVKVTEPGITGTLVTEATKSDPAAVRLDAKRMKEVIKASRDMEMTGQARDADLDRKARAISDRGNPFESGFHEDLPQRDYAVIDIETAGGKDPLTNHIIDIGVVVVRNGKRNRVSFLVKEPDVKVSKDDRRFTPITQEMIDRDGVSLAEAMKAITDEVGDLPLVGHNVQGFDRISIENNVRRRGVSLPDSWADSDNWVDTAALLKGAYTGKFVQKGEHKGTYAQTVLPDSAKDALPGTYFSLEPMRRAWKLGEAEQKHRAIDDSDLTDALYREILRRNEASRTKSVAEKIKKAKPK